MNIKNQLSDERILDKLIANDSEMIMAVFFTPGKYRNRLAEAINQMLKVDSDYHQHIINCYLQSLKASRCKKLKSFRKLLLDVGLEQILLDDFLFFLSRRKHFKEDSKTINELLGSPNDSKLVSSIWGDGGKYDKDIEKEIATIMEVYGEAPDFSDLKQQLHKHLCRNPRKFIQKYDYQESLETWYHNMAHYFIEGKPRVDLITSKSKTALNAFLKKECNSNKYGIRRMVKGFKVNGETIIEFDDFAQTLYTTFLNNGYKDFLRFKYECSIFAYILTISKNLLLKLKYEEEKRRGLHTKKETKKELKEKEFQIKKERLANQAKLLINVLEIPGSKAFFGIENEKDTLEAMKFIMEEIHIKCSSNKDKAEKRKALLKKFGKSEGYVKLMEFKARAIIDKIQPKLTQLLMEKDHRPFNEIENKLYNTLFANDK